MTRNLRIRRSAIGLFAAALLATPGLADDSADAEAFVRETVDQILEILGRKDLSTDQRRRRIEEIAYARFDFETISQRVLMKNWRRFSPDQRVEFIEQFKTDLSQYYGSRIERYEQEKVEILGQHVDKNREITVKTRIEGGKADGSIRVDYRLRKKDGPWKVVDVTIEGASRVSSYRTQYRDVLRRGSPEDLLKAMREKNAKKRAEMEAEKSAEKEAKESAEKSTEEKSSENADG
jgi:phospholipid transport system substrate-binding protein